MTEANQEMVQEIRRRLSEVPKGAVIDPLSWASKLAETYSGTVDELRELVRAEAVATGVLPRDRDS